MVNPRDLSEQRIYNSKEITNKNSNKNLSKTILKHKSQSNNTVSISNLDKGVIKKGTFK